MRAFILTLAGCLGVLASHPPASSHDVWANGTAVPPWVKNACCGPSEVHLLDSGQVHEVKGGYVIDGLNQVVPEERTFDSEDGQTWAFYIDGTPQAYVHCLFIPRSF